MLIQIDNREPNNLKEYFSKNYINTSLSNLQLGDIVLAHDDTEVIIERKTITDLASSIRDGRLREQKIRLIHNYPKKNIIYIIEGDITKNNNSMHFNKINKYTIYSSIINILVRDNINLFMSKDLDSTIEFIEMLMKKITKKTLKIIKYNETTKELFYNKEISTRNISSIKINKQANLSSEMIYKSQLACIPGISTHTADTIFSNYPTMKQLFEELISKTSEQRISIIQNIKTTKSRKLGIKIGKNVNKYLFL